MLALFYGIAKGAREGIKKKALEKSSIAEVLFLYTLLGFIFIIPFSKNVFNIPVIYFLWIFIKSCVVFAAWIFAFYSIKKMPVSLYGIIDVSRVLFSAGIGIAFLGEKMTLNKGIGYILVLIGVFMAGKTKKTDTGNVKSKYILFAVFSCFLNAVSGNLDKWLMSSAKLDSSQLQFWFMAYLTIMYAVYMLVKKEKIRFSALKSNGWIWALSILFVLGDRALFVANGYPESLVTVMTLLKQSSIFVTIGLGATMFKEKNILYRCICAVVVFSGIFAAIM